MNDRKPAPQLGGATEAFVHERASATPHAHAHAHEAARRGMTTRDAADDTAPALPSDGSLRALEEWFVAAVTAPDPSARLDADAARMLTRGPRLDAADRLGIYRHGYRARLVECLADDYPALQFALGETTFEQVCHAYVERHPSSSPSLNFFGRHMARFCKDDPLARPLLGPLRGFAADLASLEWALVEVLHARAADALKPEALAAIPVERWTDARLPASDVVRVLRFDHPVGPFFQAFKLDERPAPPAPAPSATAVYRSDMTIWRMDLTPAMATLLEALFAGETLGSALATMAETLDPAEASEAERNLMIWFREWVAGGLFARVELDDLVETA